MCREIHQLRLTMGTIVRNTCILFASSLALCEITQSNHSGGWKNSEWHVRMPCRSSVRGGSFESGEKSHYGSRSHFEPLQAFVKQSSGPLSGTAPAIPEMASFFYT